MTVADSLFTPEDMNLALQSQWTPPEDFPSLKGMKRIGLDTETRDPELSAKGPGARRPGCHVVGVSLYLPDPGRALYFPIRHEAGANMDDKVVLGWLREQAEDFTGEVVGANLGYDLDMLAEDGVEFPLATFRDVQVAERLVRSDVESIALDAVLKRAGLPQKDESLLREAAEAYDVRDIKRDLYKLPPQYVGPYAEWDAEGPVRALATQEVDLERLGLMDLWEVESAILPLLVAMRRRGVRIDPSGIERAHAEVARKIEKAHGTLRDEAGGNDVDAWAPKSVARVMDEAGVKYPTTPKTGAPSFTKEWLNTHPHPVPRAVGQIRKYEKFKGTFLDGHMAAAINGRIHCTLNQAIPRSGRFSCQDPNLQQMSKRDEELAKWVRGCFVAEEGETWGKGDYSQIEYRLLTHHAVGRGAEEARQRYIRDPKTDFHAMCAEMAKMGGAVRELVKNVNFGVVFGAGDETTARTMGKTVEEAREFLERYDRELPFVKATYRAADAEVRRHGAIRTWSGRLARLDRRSESYKGLNYRLQGGAADVIKYAMADLIEDGVLAVTGPPLLQVHDELDFSIPQTKRGRDAAERIQQIMINAVALSVPITVDWAEGPDWGSCK